MARDSMVGNLNASIVDTSYEGATTKTAETIIDDAERTISVNVKKLPYSISLRFGPETKVFDGSGSVEVDDSYICGMILKEKEDRVTDVNDEEDRATHRENEIEMAAASRLQIEQEEHSGIVTIKLLNVFDEVIDTKTLDLETEKIIRTISLDYANKRVIFRLVDGTEIYCDISAMIDDIDSRFTDVNTAISTETSRARGEESRIETKAENLVSAEESRAAGEEFRIETKAENLVSAEETRAKGVESQLTTDLNNHKADKTNPHEVTKAQVGLGNADNTSDINKPVSTAQQAALDLKLDKDNFGWAIADHTYNREFGYTAGDTVYYVDVDNPRRGYLYVAKEDITAPAGDFDYTKWDTTTLERLIWYKQDKIDANNKLFADYVDDSTATHKFATSEQLTQIATNAADISNHKADKANPHEVTKTQVGLGDVVNTGDSATPVENGTAKFTTGGAYTLKTNLETSISDEATARSQADTNLQNQIDLDIEVVPYQTETALTTEQIEKAKIGKLAIFIDGINGICTYRNYSSNFVYFANVVAANGKSGSQIDRSNTFYALTCNLNTSTGLLSGKSATTLDTVADTSNNFITNTTIPEPGANGTKIIRALNLRKTQDMIADVYDATATYSVSDYAIYQNDLYRCKTAISTAEAFDSTKWDRVKAAEVNNEDQLEFIEYYNYTSANSLNDAQIEKAKRGKLGIKDGYDYYYYKRHDSNGLRFESFSGGSETTSDSEAVRNQKGVILRTAYIDLTNKKTTGINPAAARYMSVANDSSNFFANTFTPDGNTANETSRRIVRAQNLRKTQDMISPDYYDATATYNVGDVVIYQNDLYECNTAISTAEAWTAAHWTKTNLSELVEKYKINILELNGNSGTLSAKELEVACSKRCAIVYNGDHYLYTYSRISGNYLYFTRPASTSMGDYLIYEYYITINTTSGVWERSHNENTSIRTIIANVGLSGTESELTGLQVGASYSKYKVLNSEQFYPAYNSTYTYSIGDIVSYLGKFYICISAISTAEAWTAAHWSETNPGQQVVTLTATSGTLTDTEYAKVASKNALILYNNFYYLKYKETNNNYKFSGSCFEWDSANGRHEKPDIFIDKTTKAYSISTYTISSTTANPALAGTEAELTSLKVGSTKYKVPTQAQSIAYSTTAPIAANTDGLKIVVLSSEPATRYDGWLYIITEE